MTTKERIAWLVGAVARYTAEYFRLGDPDDVKENHVDFAYEILWANDKKGVELNTDRYRVEEAIRTAIEEWNLSAWRNVG